METELIIKLIDKWPENGVIYVETLRAPITVEGGEIGWLDTGTHPHTVYIIKDKFSKFKLEQLQGITHGSR